MVGSVITGIDPNKLTVDDIENGQNKVMTNPREGLRMVYIPQDSNDYGFYNCTAATSHN